MTDRPTLTADLDKAFSDVEAMLTLLYARAREDVAAAVLSGQTYEPRVSGRGVQAVDPDDPDAGSVSLTGTERSSGRLTAQPVPTRPDGTEQVLVGDGIDSPTYREVLKALRRAADMLARTRDDITPDGSRCITNARDDKTGKLVECERMAVARGRCGKCLSHLNAGDPPDATLLRDWNGRLDRDCGCESHWCAGAHEPGGCLNRIKPGEQARVCGTCTNRIYRARKAERSTTGTGGAFEWQDPA